MSSVLAIESAFRSFEDNAPKTKQLIDQLENVLRLVNNEQTEESTATISPSGVSIFRLPKATEVKFPGRPMHQLRFPSTKKDYKKADFRKQLVLFNKRIAMRTAAKIVKTEEREKTEEKVTAASKSAESKLVTTEKLVLPQKRKRSNALFVQEKIIKENENQPNELYKPKKLGQRHIRESDLPCALNAAINIENVKLVFNPKSDGYCGYRAISFIHYGKEEEYLKVKEDMLKALEENKEVYEKKLAFDVASLRDNIERGMESKSPVCKWFNTPDCAQVVADAYNVPVCIYSDPQNTYIPSLTYLPLNRSTEKPKNKIRSYNLQNQGNFHWVAVIYGYVQDQLPKVEPLYFTIDPKNEHYFKYFWNCFKQFPKLKVTTNEQPIFIELD